MYFKMKVFIPPAGDLSLRSEFECWQPEAAYVYQEEDGIRDWKGGEVKPIMADEALPHVDLPKQMKDLIKHCWKNGAPSAGAQRGRVQIGGARQNAFNNIQPTMPANLGGASGAQQQMAGLSQQKALQQQQMMARGAYQKQVSPTAFPVDEKHLQGIATDWNLIAEMERINAYTFRGDGRSPGTIKTANGFQPPASRTDRHYVENGIFPEFQGYLERRFNVTIDKQNFLKAYDATVRTEAEKQVMANFMMWRSLADREAMHVGRMLANEALKGYISTTRAANVAKGFANGGYKGGWVYLTLVKGGFVIPEKKKHLWTSIYGEQEIALPGSLAWPDIYGFRQVGTDGRFAGPIYFRKDFFTNHKVACKQAHDIFSGMKQ